MGNNHSRSRRQRNQSQIDTYPGTVTKAGIIAMSSRCVQDTMSPDLSGITNKPQPLKVSYFYTSDSNNGDSSSNANSSTISDCDCNGDETFTIRRITVTPKNKATATAIKIQPISASTPLTAPASSTITANTPLTGTGTPSPTVGGLTISTSSNNNSIRGSRINSAASIPGYSPVHVHNTADNGDSGENTPVTVTQRQRYIGGSDGADRCACALDDNDRNSDRDRDHDCERESVQDSEEVLHSNSSSPEPPYHYHQHNHHHHFQHSQGSQGISSAFTLEFNPNELCQTMTSFAPDSASASASAPDSASASASAFASLPTCTSYHSPSQNHSNCNSNSNSNKSSLSNTSTGRNGPNDSIRNGYSPGPILSPMLENIVASHSCNASRGMHPTQSPTPVLFSHPSATLSTVSRGSTPASISRCQEQQSHGERQEKELNHEQKSHVNQLQQQHPLEKGTDPLHEKRLREKCQWEGYHIIDPEVIPLAVPARQNSGDLALLELEADAHITPPISTVIHTHTPFNSPRRMSSPLGRGASTRAYTVHTSNRLTVPIDPPDTHVVLQCNKWKRQPRQHSTLFPSTKAQAQAQSTEAPSAILEDCMVPPNNTSATSAFDKWSTRAAAYGLDNDEERENGSISDSDSDSVGDNESYGDCEDEINRQRDLILIDLEDNRGDGNDIGDNCDKGSRHKKSADDICSCMQSPVVSPPLSVLIPSQRIDPAIMGLNNNYSPPVINPHSRKHSQKRRPAVFQFVHDLRLSLVSMLGCQDTHCASTPRSNIDSTHTVRETFSF